jgi:C4-dicarboxylate-specific signal transduction histidine kinase
MKLTLRKKIVLSIIIACVAFGATLAVVTYYYISNVLVNEKTNTIGQLGFEKVREIDQILSNNQLFVKMLATRTRVKEFLLDKTEARRFELLNIFSDYAKEDTKYLAIYLLDEKGNTLISTDNRFNGQNYSFRDYFKKAKNKESSVDVFIGKTSNEFGYYFAHPVLSGEGRFVGVMVVKIDSKSIDDSIMNSEVSKDGSVMATDENGVIIFSNKPNRLFKSLGNLSVSKKEQIASTEKFLGKEIVPIQYDEAQQIINNYTKPETLSIFDTIDNEKEILNVTKLDQFPFYLVMEIGLEDVEGKVFKVTMILVLIILTGLILMSFIIYKFVSIIIKPLKELKAFSQKISSGDFSERIKINTSDELNDLAKSFNDMTDKLSGLYDKLEQKVKERTEKLEKSEVELKHALLEEERVNKIMVGRELEMIKFKKEIAELKNKK